MATAPMTSRSERLAAIGPTAELAPELRRALDPDDSFEPLPPPGPHDWLANHAEAGQTFAEFLASHPNRPDGGRHTLYLQPLGAFGNDAPPLEVLLAFAGAFFVLPVALLPALDVEASRITRRRNPSTGATQLLTGDILARLATRLPDDAFALLGITMEDLYPAATWSFVFGQASLRERVGVFSFARYDPRFSGESRPAEDRRARLLRRSCRVLAHEMAHMFGIAHCIYYRCLMNGSNHLAESDARPLHLCPVDLRKLHASTGFDVVNRYERLRAVCETAGFRDEAEWLDERLAYISAS